MEERVDAELALGRHAALVARARGAVSEHPLPRTPARAADARAVPLWQAGRRARGVPTDPVSSLNIELGLEPGVELQQLERAILVQDPALDAFLQQRGPDDGASRATRRARCPFKGLAPFERADAEFFFGRERSVGELMARLADSALLAVVGPSGSGKSSLLRAGLCPRSQRANCRARALAARSCCGPAHAGRGARPARTELPRDRRPAGGSARRTRRPVRGGLHVCRDDEERRAFIDAIVESAWDPERRALILLALRADFFGRVARVPGARRAGRRQSRPARPDGRGRACGA